MAEALQIYAFKAKDHTGRIQRGKMEGDSQNAVRDTLISRGVRPIHITTTKTTEGFWDKEIRIRKGPHVSQRDMAATARQLSAMISAGIPIVRALEVLMEQTESSDLRKTLKLVRNDVDISGATLSEAFEKHPMVFPPLMINLTRAGETGGFLDEAMQRIAGSLEADAKLRSKIVSAMTYPTVVAIFAVLMLAGVLIWVVPVFEKLYKQLGGALPLPTAILVHVSKVFRDGAPFIAIAIVLAVIWWQRNKHRRPVREIIDPIKLKLPVFGLLFQKVAMSRFARNFGTLMHAGVPVLTSLDVVAEATGSVVISDAIQDVKASVRDGDSLAQPLTQHATFPPMVVQMLSVGEETGAVDELLTKIADYYDYEVEATTEALTSLIEPILVVMLGVLVGAMVISLYWPVFSIFDLIKQ